MKKTVILLVIFVATFSTYTISMYKPKTQSLAKPLLHAKKSPSKSQTQPAQHEKTPPTRYAVRPGGILTSGTAMGFARLDIWKDHYSRMTTPTHWIIGKGLGMAAFEKKPHPKAARWYLLTDHGYQLHIHSGYFWALYTGGLIGFVLLLSLMAMAGWTTLRAGTAGYLPLALIIFCATTMSLNSSRLLLSRGPDYLLFWIPLALAAGLSSTKKNWNGGMIPYHHSD